MRLGALASGEFALNFLKHITNNYFLVFVMTDSKSNGIISFCAENNIPVFVGNPRNNRCVAFIKGRSIDVLISTNYLFLIEKELITLPKLLAFNIHGSLLPKYRGRTPHVWAIINNEKMSGVTAHAIEEDCDSGDILKQVEVIIENEDTGATILQKFNAIYIRLIDNVLKKVEHNRLSRQPQNNELATYFGKRTPDDGLINWSWQKERIYNWVRAQASPYPGAFTYIMDSKLIIDKISFSNIGFRSELADGTILAVHPKLIIKTPNGGVQLEIVRNNELCNRAKVGLVLR